ncbi:MAG: tRNA (adenosine(37)-N6)-dimethylallyltransferase MiaA [Clostridia bacterium]|nr:tRNA (adenosine(37)-N6)-dimethylallyltransferase MiaA [Clostridia bacterium]
MEHKALPKVIVIAGTNASGKSALGIQLAQRYQGEIISADSRQIYEGFDLCCGKVTPEERAMAPHHLLDVRKVGQPYSAADYQRDVYAVIPQIIQRQRLPFIVGGTGLYISAVVRGYEFREEKVDFAFRDAMEEKPLEELQAMLPPDWLAHMSGNQSDINNKRRIIRALERARNGEGPLPANQPRFSALQLGVRWEKEELDRRIDQRLDMRLEQGMVEEVKAYLDAGGDPDCLYRLGLEYRYIAWYLMGKYATFEAFKEELARAIKQFAGRQVTWFKKDPAIHWLDMEKDPVQEASRLIDSFLAE